ncbi:MAG: hypothetical protein ABI700_24320, partial [Chloroflexota bacterium]
GEALTIADNVLLMNDGNIEQEGAPLDIYRNPRTLFSATFIGTNNFLPGVVREVGKGVTAEVENLGITFRADTNAAGLNQGAPVWVCIRADDIDVIPADQAANYPNVIKVHVDRASLTGGFVIVEGKLKDKTIRIHVGGGRRFELLEAVGTTITCGLSNVALIPREESSHSEVSSLQPSA